MTFPARDVPLLCAIGAGVATFWRGAWYTLDATLFPDDMHSSCAASLALGFGGFATLHTALPRLAPASPAMRCAALYAAALANVAAWRGVWMALDLSTDAGPVASAARAPPPTDEDRADRQRMLVSGVASHACATAFLIGMSHLTSALAPPARIAVLSDRTKWAWKPSRYLEDLGMFLKQKG